MVKLPQSFIDEVLSRIDIVEIIEARLTLKKIGKANYQANCPFHHEKTPSFTVSQNKQFYYCFGCKANGNAISFLMMYEKLGFMDVIESLAAKAGLNLPQAEPEPIRLQKKTSLSLLDRCTSFFQHGLSVNQKARDYLLQRGLDDQIMQHFRIGYAPSGWENLAQAVGKSGVSKPALFEVGMLVQKNQDGYYDRFRDRIMFPIRNKRGQIIAFGGRSLGNEMPKYLNSPETNFYHKSQELYGLYEALQANPQFKRIIVVEGYLDVIALHQHGFTETVATLGTAISTQHIQTLLRVSNSLIFCFDGDLAGKTAAWRALEIAFPLMNAGLNVHFLFLPNKEDPDSFVRKEGSEKLNQALKNATSLIDFFFQKLCAETEITTLSGKTRLVHLANKYLEALPHGIFQTLIYEKLAEVVGLNQERITELLKTSDNMPQKPFKSLAKNLSTPMKLAISLLLQSPLLLQAIKPPEISELKLPGSKLLQKMIAILIQNPHLTTGSFIEYFVDEERTLLSELAAQDLLIPQSGWEHELNGAFHRLKAINIENQIQELLQKGNAAALSASEKKLLQTLLITQKSESDTTKS